MVRKYPRRFNHYSLLLLIAWFVAGLTIWSFIAQPTATLVATLPLNDRMEHRLGDEVSGTSWWHMRLLLDSSANQAGIIASAEDDEGLGHHLQWDPRTLVWRLTRSGPGPSLLAQSRLSALPRRMSVHRFGYRFEVRVDGERVASGFDFADAPPARHWRLLSEFEGNLPRLEIHDHVYLASATVGDDSNYQDFHSILQDFHTGDKNDHLLYQQAGNLIAYFQEPHHSQTHLWTWLMWAYGSSLIERGQVGESSSLDAVIEYLRVSGSGEQAPSEVPGLLLDLQQQVVRRALIVPEAPTPAAEFIARRGSWLRMFVRIHNAIEDLANHSQASKRGHYMGESDRFHSLLSKQIALTFSGEPPAAMPAESPSWLSTRVRALQGRLPIDLPFPEIGRDWFPRPWSRAPLEHLLQLSEHFSRGSELRTRAAILSAIRDGNDQGFLDLIEQGEVRTRTRVIMTAILAVHGVTPVADALAGLTRKDADGISLSERDPLAYALFRLLHHRRGEDVMSEDIPPIWGLPPGLTPYRQLLDGGYGATIIAFSRPGDTIPPAEALASALAMQEVSGIRPQWDLLRFLPSLSLPLSLLIPPPPQPVPTFNAP